MSINLEKGQKVEVTKTNPGLTIIKVGLGWDINKFASTGAEFDLDAIAFVLDANGKLTNDKDIVYFNNLKHPSGAITHSGDNLTGKGEGDDEVITVDLSKVPADKQKIAFAVAIYRAEERKQNFGMVENSFIRVFDDKQEYIKFNLGEDHSVETYLIAGEVYRHNGDWKFSAVGTGAKGGLLEIAKSYGLS